MTIRRTIALCAALVCSAALTAPISAQAFPYIGISQSFQDFGMKNGTSGKDVSTSKYWSGLRVGSLRVIVPWDIATRSATDPRRKDFEQFLLRVAQLRASQGIGIDPYVVFGPTELQNTTGGLGWTQSGYLAPTTANFTTAITAFLNIYGPKGSSPLPHVRMIGAWNEPNREPFDMQLPGPPVGVHPVLTPGGQHMEAPSCPSPATATNCGPILAASYWKAARDAMNSACTGSGLPGCYTVAGEFDSGFGTDNSQPYWTKYADQITSNFPKQISFHGHHDVDGLGQSNDCVAGSDGPSRCITSAFADWLAARGGAWANRSTMAIWNTELHSEYHTTSGTTPNEYQKSRFEHLVTLSNQKQVKRIYYFSFQTQGSPPPHDFGLIAPGSDLNAAGANRALWWYLRDRLPAVAATASAAAANADADSEGTIRIPEGDVDADGYADLVTLHSTGTADVFPGQADSHFGTAIGSFAGTMDPAEYDGTGHYVVDVEDVNGDLHGDLITLTSSGTACVYPGQDDGTFGPSCVASFAGTMVPGILSPGGHYPIGVADVTGDGRGDLVTFYSPTGVTVTYPGQADGTFGAGVQTFAGTMDSATFDKTGHYMLDVADVTGDGRADLVTMTNPSRLGVVYPGQANGSFGDGVTTFAGTLDTALDDGVGHEPVAVADVTGDHRADLVTFAGPSGVVVTYPGQANGTFGDGKQSFAGTMDSSLFDGIGHELDTVIDVNGDGFGDLVTATSNGDVAVYSGHADGSFTGPVTSFSGTFASARFNHSGHELAMEKPALRRRGCAPSGC